MSNKVLWLDVDGVLLDWVRPFLKFIGARESYDRLYQYDLSNLFDGNAAEMRDWIDRFNVGEEYEQLEALVSKEVLGELKNAGYTLNLITQTTSPASERYRDKNLNLRFGPDMFGRVIYTRAGENKAQILRKIEPYEAIHVVEDNPKFFSDALRIGGCNAMAVLHPYNRQELKALKGFPIYTGMSEVVRHLCNS